MPTWICKQCDQKCTFTRVTVFPPERCVYIERGNGTKTARWIKSGR